MNNKTINKNKF